MAGYEGKDCDRPTELDNVREQLGEAQRSFEAIFAAAGVAMIQMRQIADGMPDGETKGRLRAAMVQLKRALVAQTDFKPAEDLARQAAADIMRQAGITVPKELE